MLYLGIFISCWKIPRHLPFSSVTPSPFSAQQKYPGRFGTQLLTAKLFRARSGFRHCWLFLPAIGRPFGMVMCSKLFWHFVSYWPIFVTYFTPIQNMCSPLFTFILTLLTKALRSKRPKVFLFILGSSYTTLHANICIIFFEERWLTTLQVNHFLNIIYQLMLGLIQIWCTSKTSVIQLVPRHPSWFTIYLFQNISLSPTPMDYYSFKQWRSQPDDLALLCEYFGVQGGSCPTRNYFNLEKLGILFQIQTKKCKVEFNIFQPYNG